MCPILYHYNMIPAINIIQFIVPDISILYNINIFMGNNILSEDNISIYKQALLLPEKVIYIKLKIDYTLYYYNMILINIYTKTKTLLEEIIIIPIIDIPIIIKIIDINKYKLIFELKETIDTIKIKINNIKIDENDKTSLIQKLDKIIFNITTFNNIKILEIKNNLKNKFFI